MGHNLILSICLGIVVCALTFAVITNRSGSKFDQKESDFQSYLSVCSNQAGYDVGKCLFAWQYPEQAKALGAGT